MPGMMDLLGGAGGGGPMDLRSLAGKMGMAAQEQTVGGPVQNQVGMPSPGGMNMAQPGQPGPMMGPGMQNPMIQQAAGAPPPTLDSQSPAGLATLLQFSKMEDQEIIELVISTKPQHEVADYLMSLGQQLGRPALLEAGMMAEQGVDQGMFGSEEGLVG